MKRKNEDKTYNDIKMKTHGNIYSKSNSINNIDFSKDELNKKNMNFIKNIHLEKLYKDLPRFEKIKSKNIYTYYEEDGRGVTRGEKIKFLKTTYPVNILKPLNTQKSFKLINTPEKKIEKIYKKFPINHYNLDILNKNNKILLKKYNHLQNNIGKKIRKEFLEICNSINDIKLNEL